MESKTDFAWFITGFSIPLSAMDFFEKIELDPRCKERINWLIEHIIYWFTQTDNSAIVINYSQFPISLDLFKKSNLFCLMHYVLHKKI